MGTPGTAAPRQKGKKRRGSAVAPAAGPPAGVKRQGREPLSTILLPATRPGRRILGGVLLVALGFRVYNLLGMFPILVDESIYLRWAEIIEHQGQWFISLLDGKPPLTYWLLALGRIVIGGDPLLEGRLLSVFFGLLSTLGIFALARRAARGPYAESAGLAAAALYAVFPWALLYDRLAYTEAAVNCFGIWIALTAVVCFEKPGNSWKREIPPGLAFGLGLFTKQTVLLFGLVPAAAAFFFARKHARNWIVRLAILYGIAALFLAANFVLTPEAPTLETHDAVLHHKGFFAKPADLLADPFGAARSNIGRLASFMGTYLTWPAALAALAGAVWLGIRGGSFAPWLLLSASIAPLAAQVFLLAMTLPTRYPFPHVWPWLVAAAAGGAAMLAHFDERPVQPNARRAALALAAALIAGPVLYRAVFMLADPDRGLHESDVASAQGFRGDSAHVGWGIREAAGLIEMQARASGGLILLTDPVWGPPADAMFPFLNHKHGIRVYEAWWMQLSGTQPILPQGRADVLRSHYERVEGGTVDFNQARLVLYVTDTNINPKAAVLVRQPNAQLVASFPKPGGEHSIDLYRLK